MDQGLLIVEVTRSHSGTLTLGRTPLEERSARRRDLFLIKYNTLKSQTTMPAAGFEPTTPASERLQTQTLDQYRHSL